jgi:GDSL/SGNH-like Acyl-Esterase family found in Pmr5 and Cas1p
VNPGSNHHNNGRRLSPCQTQLFYILSDTLVKENYGALNRGPHWLEIGRNQSIVRDGDILILTVGAHIAQKQDLYNVSHLVLQQITTLQHERPSVVVVYKTQQPGGCTRDIANVSLSPLQVGATTNQMGVSSSSSSSPYWLNMERTYNYPFFFDHDLAVIRQLQQRNIPFLDMRMLYSRSDAHPSSKTVKITDCMHFCSPGPLDVFPMLLLQLFRNEFAVSPCVY